MARIAAAMDFPLLSEKGIQRLRENENHVSSIRKRLKGLNLPFLWKLKIGTMKGKLHCRGSIPGIGKESRGK